MAGGRRGDEFNSQMHSVEELLSETPEKDRPEASDERVGRTTLLTFAQSLATQLDKTLNRQMDISREMAAAARTIAEDQNGRAATQALKAIHEDVQKMHASSHIHQSILFVMQEIRDINYDIRGEMRMTNNLLETLTTLLSNGHGAH